MSIIWQAAPTPFIDPNGAPYSGARAYFFDAGTTTPRIVYTTSTMSIPHDHPIVANGSGVFPAVFLPAGDYRVRIETADGVALSDVDGITTPGTGSSSGGGDGGSDSVIQTGDFVYSHRAGARDGFVRANGRTIGNPSSGATERANVDCEALFGHLWNVDSTLAVSGGRGATAGGDWTAGKRIDLPDLRRRALAGLSGMGNAALDPGLSAYMDGGETADTLGATGGASSVTLSINEMPSHNHNITDNGHAHNFQDATVVGGGGGVADGTQRSVGSNSSTTAVAQTGIGIQATGGGGAHQNLQPTFFATVYIKL